MSDYNHHELWKLGPINGLDEGVDFSVREVIHTSSLAIANSCRLDEDGMTTAETRYEEQIYFDPCHVPRRYHRRPIAGDGDSTVEAALVLLLLTPAARQDES